MRARRQVRHAKGYVRFWASTEWMLDYGHVLKNAIILKEDPIRERVLVEARKFRWPNK